MKKVIIALLAVILISVPVIYFVLPNNLNKNKKETEETTISSSSAGGGGMPLNTEKKSRCEGLNGELEMKVLVGPADAAGMEPVAVGSIPFKVVKEEGDYIVQGEGDVSYDQTVGQVWGSYSVSLDMQSTLEGSCTGPLGSETLNITVVSSGNQMVEVRADGFSGDYPWEGTRTLDLSFPLQENATAKGEGWEFVLHLSK